MALIGQLPRGRRLAGIAAVVLFIDLFLSWQKACANTVVVNVCGSQSGWHGIGVIVGLLAIAVIVWEGLRLAGQAPSISLDANVVSAGLAGLAGVFAVIEFLSHSDARHWPAWIGLILAVVLLAGAWLTYSAGEGVPPLSGGGATGAGVPPPGGGVSPPGAGVPPPSGGVPPTSPGPPPGPPDV
jgi:hypothetical protein